MMTLGDGAGRVREQSGCKQSLHASRPQQDLGSDRALSTFFRRLEVCSFKEN